MDSPTPAQNAALPPQLQFLYPFPLRSLALGSERLSYADTGTAAAPMLFLHGAPAWSFLFRDAMAACEPHFRVIAPDLVGFGLSSMPDSLGYHTLARHTENLLALIDVLGLEKLTLVLHGTSAPIGLNAARLVPEKISRIVVLNSTPIAPLPVKLSLPMAMRLLGSGIGSAFAGPLLGSWLSALNARPLAREVLAAYRFPLEQPNGTVGPLAFVRQLGAPPEPAMEALAANLHGISTRVELLWGKRDPLFGRPLAAYTLRDGLGNAAEPRFVEDCGHFLPEDAPQALTGLLLEPLRPKPVKPQPLFTILK